MRKRTILRIFALVLVLALALPVAAQDDDPVVIVLDPGHGGLDSGVAVPYDGVKVWESTLCLKIAQYCRDYLLEHYENVEVYLTREVDTKMSLEDRVQFAALNEADYMLSIHINSNNGKSRGALALVPRGKYRPAQGAASTRTAEAILEELAALGMTNRGTVVQLGEDRYPDGSYVDYYGIVRGCVKQNIPGIIMEHGFLDNEQDYREFLSTDEKLAALGAADARGLAQTLGLRERRAPSSAENGDTPFEDVILGEWYYDDVTYVWMEGLMQGISESEFGAALPANRAMVVTLLYRMAASESVYEESSFQDVEPGVWFHAPVEWALENGITTGVSQTEFAPGRNVIREQFVTFLHRYAGQPEPAALPEYFADWDTVSSYARNAMAWAVEAKLVTGYEDGTVRPLRELNRAELAVLMHRFHRWYLHETGELTYEWTQSVTEAALHVGESFELTLVNQYGAAADPVWEADCEGVVEIHGTTVTAVGEGTVLLTCEWDGMLYDCFVTVEEKVVTWYISHEDVTIKVGESFNLRVRSSEGETASVTWNANKSGYVTISGNKITGKAAGTVTVSCDFEGETYKCIVRVKSK